MPVALNPRTPYANPAGLRLPNCPHCQGDMMRVHRRPIDRALRWFTPAQRYRCLGFSCQWEGNIRVRPTADGSPGAATTNGLDAFEAQADAGISRFFVASMAAALAGAVFIVMGTYADWLTPRLPDEELASESTWRTSPVAVPAAQTAPPPATR